MLTHLNGHCRLAGSTPKVVWIPMSIGVQKGRG
jgi:hypothetical protein